VQTAQNFGFSLALWLKITAFAFEPSTLKNIFAKKTHEWI
jgi:hypothetical protein